MIDDLVKRLRSTGEGDAYLAPTSTKIMIDEAADRIEKLEAALRDIETLELDPRNSGQMWVEALRQIARAALREKTDD